MGKMTGNKPHAFITGGNGAIGSNVAYRLVQEGYRVTISGRNEESLISIATGYDDISYVVFDITDPKATASTLAQAFPIDLAILNAGAYQPGPTSETTSAQFHQMMDVNYFGVVNCLLPLLEYMQEHGGHIAIVAFPCGVYRVTQCIWLWCQ